MASHDHTMHDHHDHLLASSSKNIAVAFFLNAGFTIIEFIGGFLTNSIAITADAVHDLGDSLMLGLSWFFQKLSGKRRTDTFSYGFRRFSLIGALLNSVVLIAGSVIILLNAIPRLIEPQATDAAGMIVLALLGILINGIAYFRLRKEKGMNGRVVSIHILEDFLGWFAVLAVGLVNTITYMPILDPLLAIIFALVILNHILRNLVRIIMILFQAAPAGIDMRSMKQKIEKRFPGTGCHDIHVWSMDNNYNILTMHIVVKKKQSLAAIDKKKKKIKDFLKEQGIEHSTIEFECYGSCCDSCD